MMPDDYVTLSQGHELNWKNNLRNLTPFFDPEWEVIRVGGRLGQSPHAETKKVPILTSNKSILSLIIFMKLRSMVGGQLTLSLLVCYAKESPLHVRSLIVESTSMVPSASKTTIETNWKFTLFYLSAWPRKLFISNWFQVWTSLFVFSAWKVLLPQVECHLRGNVDGCQPNGGSFKLQTLLSDVKRSQWSGCS